MKYLLILVPFFLYACSSVDTLTKVIPQDNDVSIELVGNKSGSGFIKNGEGYTSSGLSSEIYDQVGEINLVLGKDGKYREKNLGYIVHNPESCTFDGIKGIFDWRDTGEWKKDQNGEYIPGADIIEAGCFKSKNKPVLEDENGTYYGDKDGGGYNLQRITTRTGGIYTEDLVTVDESGWIRDRVPLLYFEDPTGVHEVYYMGRVLSGVTSIYSLKILDLKDNGPLSITDGKNVWKYKSQFIGTNPLSLRYRDNGVYLDDKSCYIELPLGEIKKLENCNPKSLKKLTEDPGNWMDTKMYTDGKNTYNAYGDIINP